MVTSSGDSVLAMVESLSGQLTNEKAEERAAAMAQLANHVAENAGTMNQGQVHHLAQFLCNRLSDNILVLPATLHTIHSLMSPGVRIDPEDVRALLNSMFSQLYTQSFRQETRLAVYSIMNRALDLHGEACRQMEKELVLNVVRMVDGEKDPRNLLQSFHLVTLLASQFGLSPLTEEVFEVFSCYFPVEFQDSPTTRELNVNKRDLTSALTGCFSACWQFAEFAVPFLTDKLTADVVECKLDTLALLEEVTPIYLPPFSPWAEQHATELWHTLFSELMTCSSEKVLNACLNYFPKFLATILKLPLADTFVSTMVEDTKSHFQSLGTKGHHITTGLMREVLSQYQRSDILLHTIGFLVDSVQRDAHKLNSCVTSLGQLLSAVPPYSDDAMVGRLEPLVFTVMQQQQAAGNDNLLNLMPHLLKFPPISQKLFELVNAQLCSAAAATASQADQSRLQLLCPVFDSFYSSVTHDQLTTCIQLITLDASDHWLSLVIVLSFPPAFFPKSEDAVQILSNVFFKFLSASSECSEAKTQMLNQRIVKFIGECDDAAIESIFVQNVCKICLDETTISVILSKCQPSKADIVSRVFKEISSKLSGDSYSNLLERSFEAMEKTQNEQSRKMFCAVFLNSRLERVNERILQYLFTSQQIFPELSLVMAACVNKMSDLSSLDCFMDLWSSKDIESREECQLFLLMTHALIRRGHPLGPKFIDRYFQLLDHPSFGSYIAEGMEVLVSGGGLDQVPGVRTRIMFTQQFFHTSIHRFTLDLIKAKPTHFQTRYMVAVMCLIARVPQQMVSKHLTSLVPLVVHSLSTDLPDVLVRTLLLLHSALHSSGHHDVIGYVPDLHPRLLQLCKFEASQAVRMNALKCVGSLCEVMGVTELQPMRSATLRTLTACLDDRKRLVRREAVAAKAKWASLNS